MDLAIRHGLGGWKGVRERRLFKAAEHLVPVVSRALLAKPPTRLTARDVAALPLVHSTDAAAWRLWCEAHGLAFRARPVDRTFAYHHLALSAARAGLGAALQQTPPQEWNEAGSGTVALTHLAVPDMHHWFLLQLPAQESAQAQAVATAILRLADRPSSHAAVNR
jgi:LysR family transcriptional regulator, glycine cleavage system transcriptional activator